MYYRSSRRSGSRQIHRGRKERVKFAAMWSPFWSLFSTSKAFSTRNSYPWSNRQWQVLLWGFEAGEVGHLAQTSRQVEEKPIGFSTMTTYPLTHHSLFNNSWPPKTLQWFPTPPIRLTSPPTNFSYSPRWNYGWKGVVLIRLKKSTQKRKRLSTYTHIWELPGVHEIMGNMLGSLYTCPRGLLWRRQWKLVVRVRNYFFMVKFPKFLGSAMYFTYLWLIPHPTIILANLCVCVCTCMYVCMYVCMCMYLCMHVCIVYVWKHAER